MKPFKTYVPIARWLLRISLTAMLFFYYFTEFKNFNLHAVNFYLAAVYIVFASLLFIGGFLSRSSLTVISSLIIFILSVYSLIVYFPGFLNNAILAYLLPASLSLYFLSTGNES